MVAVKGRSDSAIPNLTNLGLTNPQGKVRVSLNLRHMDLLVDSWGNEIPVDVQWMLADATITMTLVHFDRTVFDTCQLLSMGNPSALGQVARAGNRLGGNSARFSVGNNFISLNISSPVGNKPWRFYTAYLTGNAYEFPLGTERSELSLTWRAIPFSTDPYGGGTGAANTYLWDHVADS